MRVVTDGKLEDRIKYHFISDVFHHLYYTTAHKFCLLCCETLLDIQNLNSDNILEPALTARPGVTKKSGQLEEYLSYRENEEIFYQVLKSRTMNVINWIFLRVLAMTNEN